MNCGNCGNKQAYAWKVIYSKNEKREECNACGQIYSIYVPDVYWRGPGYHPGILDSNNKPIFLESRSHKAKIMKEQGLREAGDRHHGQIGTEAAHVHQRQRPNENVMTLKKIFEKHEKGMNRY